MQISDSDTSLPCGEAHKQTRRTAVPGPERHGDRARIGADVVVDFVPRVLEPQENLLLQGEPYTTD